MSAMDRAFLTDDPDAGQVILVRHGQQDFPEPGTKDFSKWVDPPLSKVGLKQAEAVGRFLASFPIVAVYSSQLSRARVTGEHIAEAHGLEVIVDDRLHEVEIFQRLPAGQTNPADAYGADALAKAQDDFVATRMWSAYPGSESGAELRARITAVVEEIIATHRGEVVAIACHGGVINAYVAEILGVAEDMFYRPGHASVHRVACKGDRRVVWTLNEIAHLDPDIVTW